MQTTIIEQPEILFIGVKTRTKNDDEFNSNTAKIGPLVGRYYAENLAEKIPSRKNQGTSVAVYSNYESDEYGAYDYYFGEAVTNVNILPEGMTAIKIPGGKFLKITTPAGKMPDVVIQTWQQIWEMTKNKSLGAERSYLTDFEVYDQRAIDPNNTVMDIYLSIK